MEKVSKKELKERYKNRTIIGGVYRIQCSGNGRIWIKSTKDIAGQKNRFTFSISINSCPDISMNEEWKMYGANTFSFDILEEINKGDLQTDQEFSDDLGVLLEIWLEKHRQDGLN